MAIYLKFGDVKGNVSAAGFKDWIECGSLQWGVGRSISTPTGSATNREGSIPSISEVVITKQLDDSSNKLFLDAIAGTMKTKAQISITTTQSGDTQEYLTYTLKDTGVSGYSVSTGGDRPSESLSLNFVEIQVSYKPVGSDGKLGNADKVTYSISQAKTV